VIATVSDTESSTLSDLTIDWGDGTAPSPGTADWNGSAFTISGSHSYAQPGIYAASIIFGDAGINKLVTVNLTVDSAASPAELAVLQQLVLVYGLYEAQQADTGRYTAASFAPLAAGLQAGRLALAATPPSHGAVTEAISLIETAVHGLVEAVDTSVLRDLIDQAQAILDAPTGWVTTNLGALASAVATARNLLNQPDLTQIQATQAAIDLAQALAKVSPKGDKTVLIALLNVAGSLNGEQFTPSTWDPVAAAIVAGQAVVADQDASVYDVEAATDALNVALGSLILRAVKAGLKSAIDVAVTILEHPERYVPSSLSGLAEAKATAQTVYDNPNATQAQVTAAQTALVTKIAGAKLRASGSAAVGTSLLTTSAVKALALTPQAVAKAFVKTAKVKVVGQTKVGKRLVAKSSAFQPVAKLKYQWFRNGRAIAGATAKHYRVTAADKAKRLSVKVTARRGGYQTVSQTSARTVKVG
jgi:hypothetical protein